MSSAEDESATHAVATTSSAYGDGGQFLTWYVYIILCSDDSLYTGITTEPERRFRQHADGAGAKFFRGRRPLQIAYLEEGHTRSSAGRRELQIKRMSRDEKKELCAAAKI